MKLHVTALLIATILTAVYAESGPCGSDANYELDENGVMTISGNGYMRACSVSDKKK